MYLKYGSYQHAANECAVVISREGIFSADGVPMGYRERWDIQGRLQADSQAAVTAAIGALQSAYAAHGQDLGLYLDNGAITSHHLASAATAGGTQVVVPPSFPEGKGAEYSTFRNYAVAVEGVVVDTAHPILSWVEALNFTGGGPEFGFLETLNGVPQKQLLKQATTFKATQQGQAVGHGSYPFIPAPLWPNAEHVHLRDIYYQTPVRKGLSGLVTEFPVRWSYAFESELPLVGSPTLPYA